MKLIDGLINDYKLSSSLQSQIKNYLIKGISLTNILIKFELNNEQKN